MTFLINLIFSRLEKFDGPIFERVYIQVGGGGGLYSGCSLDYRFRGRIFEELIYIGCRDGVWLINGVLRYIQLIYIYIYICN